MRRFFLITGALAVLMIIPQTTVWAQIASPKPVTKTKKMSSVPTMGDTTKQSIRYGTEFSGGTGLQGGRTIYARPFVKVPKTIVGGYIDFTYSKCNKGSREGKARDCDDPGSFDQERLVPFFYSQITDRLSMAAEIEFEHGGTNNNQSDGDVKVEFATMDYRFNDALNLRAGIILSPMGRFNLIHDSPLNDLPLRPMVSRAILPSTLAESGIGFFGTFYPTALSKIDYELYIVNGFAGSGGKNAGFISESSGMRSARGSQQKDINENKAILSRVSFSPMLGIEVAGSVHHGKWDRDNQYDMTLAAIDGVVQRGPFEIMGEAAWADIETPCGGVQCVVVTEAGTETFQSAFDDSTRRRIVLEQDTQRIVPAGMFGYYVQLNYHFMPEGLIKAMPSYFGQNSTFTGILRYGRSDTNTDSDLNPNDEERFTLGINFRPVEDSVIKFAYTWNRKGVNNPAGAESPDGFQFNMSSYF